MADPDLLALLGGGAGATSTSATQLDPYGLSAFNTNVLANDPYGLAARSLGSAKFDTSTWSPGATAATSFGQAFLTGLLGRYAQQNAADQTNAVTALLPQLRSDPLSVIAPEGVDADQFAKIKANAVLRNQIDAAQQEDTQKSKLLSLLGPILGKKVDDRSMSLQDAASVLTSKDPSTAIANLSGTTDAQAEDPRYSALLDTLGIKDPALRASVHNDQQLQLVGIHGDAAKQAAVDAKQATLDAKKEAAISAEATKQQKALELYKSRTGADALVNVKNSLEKLRGVDSGPGDLAVKELFARGIMPNQALQAELLSQINHASSPADQLEGAFSNWMGGSQIGATQRNKIIDIASNLVNEKLSTFKGHIDNSILPILEAKGVPRDQVFPESDYNFYFGSLKPQGGLPPLTADVYNSLRAQGKSKDDIRALYGGQ